MKNTALLIVIAIVVIIGLWAFSGYNGMVDKQEAATTALTKARNAATQVHLDADNLTPEKMKQFEAAQNQVAQAFSRLIAVAEAYPELKASENFKALQVQEEGTENRINEARKKYNESVQAYNQTVRHFPNSLLAGVFGFDKMTKFAAAEGTEKAPDLDI